MDTDTANNSQVARPQTFYPGAHLEEIYSHYFPDGDNTDLCRDGSVDTVFSTGDGSYYVFKGSKYWKLTDDSVAAGYPRDIASDWPGTQNLY